MSYYKPIGNPEELQKKLTPNAKFSKVQTTLDTGASATVMQRFKEYDVSCKQNPGENFKRLHPNILAKYIDYIHQEQLRKNNNNNNTGGSPSNNNNNNGNDSRDIYAGDIWAGVVPVAEVPKKQIMLLDVRDPEDYVKCHIQLSTSFHYTRLNRSQNIWTADMIRVINKDDWIICIYDIQEEITTKMNIANNFFEKGVNNIMVLAGGLKEFAQRHLSLVDGETPFAIVDRPLPPPRSTLSTATRSVAGSSRMSSRTSNAGGGASSKARASGTVIASIIANGGGGGGNGLPPRSGANNNNTNSIAHQRQEFWETDSSISRNTGISVATSSMNKPKPLASSLARRSASAAQGSWR